MRRLGDMTSHVARSALALLLGTGASVMFAQSPPAGRGGPPPELPEAQAIAQPQNDDQLGAATKKLASELASAGKFSGSVFLATGDKVLVNDAWGDADRKAKVANTAETAFDIGSVGKLFTQVAILQLAEAGKLTLDEPFGKYLPDYPNPEIAGKVTIRQLMLNSGGIPDVFEQVGAENKFGTKRQLQDFVPLFASKPLEFEPGSSNRYSSSGYIILGLVVEALSGKDYFSYVKEKILDPAGMTHSGFYDRAHLPAGVARSYDGDRDVTDEHPPRGTSAGGLQASAADLFHLVQAISSGKLLQTSSVKTLRELIPSAPGAPAPSDDSKLFAYGISGGAPGVSAQVAIDAQGKYTRIVLCNASPPMAMTFGAAIRKWTQAIAK